MRFGPGDASPELEPVSAEVCGDIVKNLLVQLHALYRQLRLHQFNVQLRRKEFLARRQCRSDPSALSPSLRVSERKMCQPTKWDAYYIRFTCPVTQQAIMFRMAAWDVLSPATQRPATTRPSTPPAGSMQPSGTSKYLPVLGRIRML
jgi:hypothetical protein